MFRNVPKGPPTSSSSSPGIYRGNRSQSRGTDRDGGRQRGQNHGRGGNNSGFNNRRSNQQDNTKRGLFSDGIWLCDCSPRLPAEHFKVKKDGANHGRWFYTCQNSEGRRCGFFLWDEDAKPREEAAVLSGKRDEPRATPGAFHHSNSVDGPVEETQLLGLGQATSQTSTQSQDLLPRQERSPTSTSATLGRSTHVSPTVPSKRAFDDTGFEIDDNDADSFPWDLTAKEADDLEQRAFNAPETPRKATKTVYATPGTTGKKQLQWPDHSAQDSNDTPITPFRPAGPSDSLPTPTTTSLTLGNAATTPTPTRFYDPLADPFTSSSLTAEVLNILKMSTVTLPDHVQTSLRAVLNKHDLKAQGISKGRDMVRVALRAKEGKVLELSRRIQALEADREVDRARIRELRLRDKTS